MLTGDIDKININKRPTWYPAAKPPKEHKKIF